GGTLATTTIALNCPSDIALDTDGYLFIVDNGNTRIIGSGPYGYRCILSCSGTGTAVNQLKNPSLFSFDSNGNIFITDTGNNRVLKFMLITNNSYVSFNQPNFCPSTTWYLDAVTFSNSTMVGVQPYGIFVDKSNTLYVANRASSLVRVWYEGSISPDRTISGSLSE
ncbi:unnamed protein product, partial [Adineta steineri]